VSACCAETCGSCSSAVSLADGAQEHEEAVCRVRNCSVSECVPLCNATHHGYELLATIDGTDRKYSCSLADGDFSWLAPDGHPLDIGNS
jgi:hypothetical protein